MTREDYLGGYIAAFNRGDLDALGRYYAEDVVLHLGGKRTLTGRAAILDFYRDVFARVRETLEIGFLVIDQDGLAAEIISRFEALADWPEFVAGPLSRGDILRLTSIAYYRFGADGRFADVRTMRVQSPEPERRP